MAESWMLTHNSTTKSSGSKTYTQVTTSGMVDQGAKQYVLKRIQWTAPTTTACTAALCLDLDGSTYSFAAAGGGSIDLGPGIPFSSLASSFNDSGIGDDLWGAVYVGE